MCLLPFDSFCFLEKQSWHSIICTLGAAFFYSCRPCVCQLLVSIYLWITPCLRVCMLHSTCCFVCLLNKHLSRRAAAVQMRTQHLFTQSSTFGFGSFIFLTDRIMPNLFFFFIASNSKALSGSAFVSVYISRLKRLKESLN